MWKKDTRKYLGRCPQCNHQIHTDEIQPKKKGNFPCPNCLDILCSDDLYNEEESDYEADLYPNE